MSTPSSHQQLRSPTSGSPEASPGSSRDRSRRPSSLRDRARDQAHTEIEVEGRTLRLSNREKVMYPQTGFTKGQTGRLLRRRRARAAGASRGPAADAQALSRRGARGSTSTRSAARRTARTGCGRRRSGASASGSTIDYCLVEDLPTLIWAANLANIELHTSLSRAHDMRRRRRSCSTSTPARRRPARVLPRSRCGSRSCSTRFALQSFVKTSGSKGLQVYVPLNTPVSYEQTKPFARAVAELLEQAAPRSSCSRAWPRACAPGKVLIDWSQNDQHKTTVCVYSLRARERPTVSTPLTWEEVERGPRARRREPRAQRRAAGSCWSASSATAICSRRCSPSLRRCQTRASAPPAKARSA